MRAKLFEISDESAEGFKPMVVAARETINRPEKVAPVSRAGGAKCVTGYLMS